VKKRVALNLTLWGVIVEAVGLDPCGVTVKVFAEVLCVALVLSACGGIGVAVGLVNGWEWVLGCAVEEAV